MELELTNKFIPDYDEVGDKVVLTALRFPACSQNLLIFMSPKEQQAAQEALDEALLDEKIAELERLLERRGATLGQYRSPRNGE